MRPVGRQRDNAPQGPSELSRSFSCGGSPSCLEQHPGNRLPLRTSPPSPGPRAETREQRPCWPSYTTREAVADQRRHQPLPPASKRPIGRPQVAKGQESTPATRKRTGWLSTAETQPFCGAGRHRPTAGQKRLTMGGSNEPPFCCPERTARQSTLLTSFAHQRPRGHDSSTAPL